MHKLKLEAVTLVVHDFGGPIGLAAGIDQAPRIKRVVLFNTWLWATKDNPQALKIDRLINSWLGKVLYLNFNFSPKILLKKGFADRKKLTKTIHQHYLHPFPNSRSRQPLLDIAKSLVGASDWYQQQWEQLEVLLDKPWLVLWGQQDEFINSTYLEEWKARLRQPTIKTFSCGHFVPEEFAEDCVREIQWFMR